MGSGISTKQLEWMAVIHVTFVQPVSASLVSLVHFIDPPSAWCRHSLVACAVLSLSSSCGVCPSVLIMPCYPAAQSPSPLPPEPLSSPGVSAQDQHLSTPFPQRLHSPVGTPVLAADFSSTGFLQEWALKPHVCGVGGEMVPELGQGRTGARTGSCLILQPHHLEPAKQGSSSAGSRVKVG